MDVKSVALALAFGSKSGGKTPTGTKQIAIDANGVFTEDVAEFASVEVSVDVPNPSVGTLEITENGEYDVTEYAGARVNVAASGGDDVVINNLIGVPSKTFNFSNDSVTRLRDYAFAYTRVESVRFQNVNEIDSMAFQYCRNLKKADYPNVAYIRQYAFNGCSELETINAPLATDIYGSCFSGCSKLKDAYFPEANKIANDTFYNCKALEKCVTKAVGIGTTAFYYCSSLKVVDILGSTTGSIGSRAFQGCTMLESLIIRCEDGVMSLSATSQLDTCENLTVYVPDELVDAYKSATNWSAIADRIVGLSTYTES